MRKSKCWILVVDDYEPWLSFSKNIFQKESDLQVVGEASDGLEAVQKAKELQPDLILLDIGLPALNGIEAARRIRQVSPTSRILFMSENHSSDIANEALRTGAGGYVVKSDATSELLLAARAVLEGRHFLSASLAASDSCARMNEQPATISHSHEVEFYADDSSAVDGYARFIQSSLKDGNAVIAVLNESHRARLLPKLEADGVGVSEAIQQGRYILLDAAETLSRLTVDNMPDPVRCTKLIGDLITKAAKSVKGTTGQVAVCGETAPTLLSKGHAEGAIKLEHLWDEITRNFGLHTFCGYPSGAFPDHEADPIFQRICAEHSKVYSRLLCKT